MQTNIVLWLTTILLLQVTISAVSDTHTNPYSYFDNDYTLWKIGQLFDNHKSLFQMNNNKSYLSFKQKNIVLEIPSTVSENERYKSKLSPHLVYYLTNKYKGAKVTDSTIQDPFYISSYKLDNNLNVYIQKGFSITFSLKPGIKKAEIIDIIPSHEDILPWLCTKETLIKKPACFEEVYETDKQNVSIVVNIKIFPKTVGKHHFKLYVLAKINDSDYVIVTIPGHFSVSNNNNFQMFFYQSMFKISKTSKTYRYLWLKNEDKKMLEVTDVVSFGNNLKLSYPLEFEPSEFKDQPISAEAKRLVEENEKRDFWLVPVKSERPVLELIFNKHTVDEKTGFPELDWILLQNNIIRIIIDKNEYLYGLTTFFAGNYKFWDHDFINLGILTSKHVYHEADLYISNKTHYPVILNNVSLSWENNDFDVYISSYYRNPLALPFHKTKLKVIKLLIKYKGKEEFSILRGKVKIKTNVYNQNYEEPLSFYAVYHRNILRYKKQKHLNVIASDKAIMDLNFIQNTGSTLAIDKIDLKSITDATRNYTISPPKTKSFKSGETTQLLSVLFEKDENARKRYKEEMILSIYAFESIISKRLVFYYDTLICSPLNNSAVFRNCDELNYVNFGFLREKRRQIKKRWIIKNPAPVKQKLIRFKTQNLSNLFEYNLSIVKFNSELNTKNTIGSTKIDKNSEYPLNIELNKNDRIHLEFTISLSLTIKTLEKHVKQRSELIFYSSNDKKFSIIFEYGYIKGKIKVKTKDILVDFVYPGPLPNYTISIYSSYPVPLEIEEIKRVNDNNNIISINSFNNLIESQRRNLIVEFTIDPRSLLSGSENMVVQTAKNNNSICLHDIDKYHDNNIVWNKLRATNAYKIDAEIFMTTQLGTKIRVKVHGSIRPPDFVPNPLFLGYNILDGMNIHDLTIRNPYNKSVELKLFLAPQQFLNIDKIDQEVIEQIKINERNNVDNIICMGNKQLMPDTLRFFAQNLYFEGLEFVNHPNANMNNNHICFKMPEKNAETEILYRKLATLNNFLFEFTHFKNKENFLKENTIVINDIERYTYGEPVVSIPLTWKDKLRASIHKALRFEFLRRKPKRVKVAHKPIDNYFNLNHVKNVTEYIQRKEVYLNQKYTNETLVLKPHRSITLKQAILLRPTMKNNIQTDKNIDLFLVLKNNMTNIQAVPIKYLTVIAKLAGGSERIPNTGNKLIFNIDHIRYFDRESFYERKMQVRRLIKEDFYFENTGINPVYIKNITIGNAKVTEPCLRLLEFRPKTVLPQNKANLASKKENALKATFAFHICRRFHTNTTVPIYLHSNEQVFEFQMVITFGKYIIKSVNSELSKNVTSLLLIFFVVMNTAAWVNLLLKTCKPKRKLILKPKRKIDVFLTDERLRDRIIRYQAEIKLKMYENAPKSVEPKMLSVSKPSPTPKKGFKLMPEEDLLNQFDYHSNIYPFIKTSKFNDNSCISEETFEKLFPNASINISSDHETNPVNQRDQLFVNSYIVEEEEVNKNYGTIGDQSFSNYNIIANETFNSKDRKLRKKSDTISHEAFVNSIIIDQKLKRDPDDYDDSLEDIDPYEDAEPLSALNQLDYAFGTNLIPKAKKNNCFDNRKRSYTDYTSSLKPEVDLNSPRTSERQIIKPSPKFKFGHRDEK